MIKKILLLTLLASFSINVSFANLKDGANALSRGDYKAALMEFRPLAEKGNVNAQYWLGWSYGGINNYENQFKWYKLAAEQGHILAQNDLGTLYGFGQGVEKDDKKLFEWKLKAAKAGEWSAQRDLVYLYSNGIGTDKNLLEALRWSEKIDKEKGKQ
jgi:TPR repeat protein